MNKKENKNGVLHALKTAAGEILLVTAVLVVIFGVALFGRELWTLRTLERVGENAFYTMEYKGDYALDAFLETGASSDAELVRFIVDQITHGIPLEFELPDLGCSTFAGYTNLLMKIKP